MSKIIILLGPTASGKSQIGLELISKNSNLKIINCDSKQIYKEIPIITAQPPLNEIKSYEYSLYGYKSIYDHFDVTNWIDDAYWEINNAINLNKIPFLIGGTGFYVKSLLNGIDLRQEYQDNLEIDIKENKYEIYEKLCKFDQRHQKINLNDSYRLSKAFLYFNKTGISIFDSYTNKDEGWLINKKISNPNYKIFVFLPDREKIYESIEKRFEIMIKEGVVNEISSLKDFKKNNSFFKAHGVPEIIDFLNKKISFHGMSEKIKQNTRNYAKRQFTFFKNQFKKNKFIFSSKDDLMHEIESFLN